MPLQLLSRPRRGGRTACGADRMWPWRGDELGVDGPRRRRSLTPDGLQVDGQRARVSPFFFAAANGTIVDHHPGGGAFVARRARPPP
jgi:hypothetical protein